jgi:hypothetical protein
MGSFRGFLSADPYVSIQTASQYFGPYYYGYTALP